MAASDSLGSVLVVATCLREKSARKRMGSGVASEARDSRRLPMVEVVGSCAEAILEFDMVRYYGFAQKSTTR
jgi:hypothetical protein